MRDLDEAIRYLYRGTYTSSGITGRYEQSYKELAIPKHLEIPINSYRFELPVFAMSNFFKMVRTLPPSKIEKINALILDLYSMGYSTRYKTMSKYMPGVLIEDIIAYGQLYLPIKEENQHYYGCHGAIFTREFKPIMMCSWMVEVHNSDDTTIYDFQYPILRIRPECYLHQSNQMEKWIVKKLLPLALTIKVCIPSMEDSAIRVPTQSLPIKVEIADFPFKIRATEAPSISTTNEELLKVVINHAEELIV